MTDAATVDGVVRHPWLNVLEASPEEAVTDLLAGYADTFPYSRADAPDAARLLLGHLPVDDPARSAAAKGLMAWLESRREGSLPAEPAQLQDLVRRVSEAFEIISVLELADPAFNLRNQYIRWFDWAAGLELTPSRDARAAYLRMLALTQPLVAGKSSEPDALAPFWLRVCREAGTTYPKRYLQIGLLGLRRLPGAIGRGESPWIAGLANWALEQNPSQKEFKRAWQPIKRLHPASPKVMRKRVLDVLSQKTFKDADLESPAWWANDPDFPQKQANQTSSNVYGPPAEDYWKDILFKIAASEQCESLEPTLRDMMQRYDTFTEHTGDQYYLVRTYCRVGLALIRNKKIISQESSAWASQLARKALAYEPFNPIAWGLWRDALFSGGAYDAAIALGWDTVRRIPDDPLMRNELAEILIACGQWAEAKALLDSSLQSGAFDVVTYAILARIAANKGDLVAARNRVEEGLTIDQGDAILLHMRKFLDGNKSLPLVAGSRQRTLEAIATSQDDPTLAELVRGGNLRWLRQRLQSDSSALAELKQILSNDPTFAYAQILAVRYGIWHSEKDTLPGFAIAFEQALASEDSERLKALGEQMPKLEALILLARALLGDADAATQLDKKLRSPSSVDDERAIGVIRSNYRPVLELIDGGAPPVEAIAKHADRLRIAVYDTNEAMAAPTLLAA